MDKMLLLASLCLGLVAATAVAAERSATAEKYTWRLSDIYASDEAFEAARQDVAARLPEVKKFQGRLGESVGVFLQAVMAAEAVQLETEKLHTYALSLQDVDTRVAANVERRQVIDQLLVDAGSAMAWFRPEILALGPEKVSGYLASEPRLSPYKPYLDDILRWKPHTLSASEESLLAQSDSMAAAGHDVHTIFTNADLPYPEVTLSTGETVRLDAQGYNRYRQSPVREDRIKVFKAFWGEYGKFQRTLATSLYSQVRAHVFARDARHFASSLESALFRSNIPPAVYKQLIADVHESLPTLHRYLRLRQRMLGLDELRYEDVYAPLVASVDLRFTPEEAQEVTLKAVVPLGTEYVEALRKGLGEARWTDWLPSTGKRSGAYSTGAYAVHPYQLLNFNGRYDDVSTLAHESGHSMQTYLSNKTQPFATHDYPIFVAEVASTLNENLLLHEMLSRTKDDATRLSLLGNHLDTMRGTLFRQVQFAEFELLIHEKVEKGESLSGENMTKLYLDLERKYYGHDQGVCKVDDAYGVEWAHIPHFYYDFYVYQYATSLVASTSLARDIREETAKQPRRTERRDAYLALLSSGSSKYPIDLLKAAGVDMTTSAPFRSAIAEMNRTMDEMEAILAKKR